MTSCLATFLRYCKSWYISSPVSGTTPALTLYQSLPTARTFSSGIPSILASLALRPVSPLLLRFLIVSPSSKVSDEMTTANSGNCQTKWRGRNKCKWDNIAGLVWNVCMAPTETFALHTLHTLRSEDAKNGHTSHHARDRRCGWCFTNQSYRANIPVVQFPSSPENVDIFLQPARHYL